MTDAALPAISDRSLLREFVAGRTFLGRPYLVSPLVDFLLAGGAALMALAFFWIVFPVAGGRGISQYDIQIVAGLFATLSYFVNYPHFMASYGLLYGNLGERMASFGPKSIFWWRYLVAAVVVPVALIGYFAYAVSQKDTQLFGFAIQTMFFFVGWHYLKQSYGVFAVLSGMKGIFYKPWQVFGLKLHVYSLWLYTWFVSGAVMIEGSPAHPTTFTSITYQPLSLFKTQPLVDFLFWPVAGCAIIGWGAIVWNAVETRKLPSFTGLIGYTSMYTLLAFVRIHPLFTYGGPMFHSLQYMLFVFAYKRGEFHNEELAHHGVGLDDAKPTWLRMLGYFTVICATGALAFDVLPVYFDTKTTRWGMAMVAMPIFHVFINVHHYFIDSVIWRRGNRDVSRNLFAK